MRFIIDIIVIVVCAATALFLYQHYWDDVQRSFFNEEAMHTIYIGLVAITVTVADDQDERKQGLSRVTELRDLEGKLFIFDNDARHGIWMKDMYMPIDIIWIDKNLQIIHIAENIQPDSFPEVFLPPTGARFVLEMNAHFVSSLKLKVSDRLTLPSVLLPEDIKANLQQ